jgi:hypothetical protein
MRIRAALQCEMTTRLEKGSGLLPEVVFRLRVLSASVGYDNLVTEHVLGVGGEMAEWLGDAGHGLMRQLKPSLELHLLEKADAAILRAADTKEVRVSLGKLVPK